MRKVGNAVSNQIYNSEGKKPPVPVDADEADSAMERFIRQKYIKNALQDSTRAGSARSDEGIPPPLPPKNTTKFGFRSASSIFPLSSRARREHKAAVARGYDTASSPPSNKPSKVFGTTVGYDGPDDTERKLERLRDMGFQDQQRNAIILKGVNGNMDRAVEALVRLGEGGGSHSAAPVAPPRELRATRSMTPLNSSASGGFGLGLSVPKRSETDRPTTATSPSTNPFDAMATAQPQTAQSTGALHSSNPYGASNNPFGPPSQQLEVVNQAFQGLSVTTSPPLPFPPSAQTPQFQQYMSISSPSSPQSYQGPNFQNGMHYVQSMNSPVQPQLPMQTGYNPFFTQPPANPPQTQNAFVNNPFARSASVGSPTLSQIPEQTQPVFGQAPFITSSPQPLHNPNTNPFFTGHPSQQGNYQPPQPRHDKASIMALYNQPTQRSAASNTPDSSFTSTTPTIPEDQAVYSHASQPFSPPASGAQPRSVSQSMPGAVASNNPYLNNAGGVAGASQPFTPGRKYSRESVNLSKDMAWTNGRHSPDAFASLSARHV